MTELCWSSFENGRIPKQKSSCNLLEESMSCGICLAGLNEDARQDVLQSHAAE